MSPVIVLDRDGGFVGAIGSPGGNAIPAYVAKTLVGKCAAQTCWADDINAYALNEVAINWNAPLVWVAAFIDDAQA